MMLEPELLAIEILIHKAEMDLAKLLQRIDRISKVLEEEKEKWQK